MNYIEITKAELVVGGNVVRQGDHFTQGYIPRDYKGDKVSLTGKTITAAIYSKKGVHYEGPATFDATTGVLSVTVRENIGSGTMWVEFTATDPTNSTYKQKFPANEFDTKMMVVRGTEDLEFYGLSGATVAKFREEFDAATAALTQDSEVALARDGEAVLANRLSRDKQQLTTQLADKATEEALEIERQRISNLTANAGNTDGNAELLDIRVGFDGITYPTAGDATRALASYMTEENESWVI